MIPMGLRKARVFKNTTEEVIDMNGNYGYIEVTNDGASDVEFMVNDFPEQGHPGTAIPIKAGTTRAIPMAIYKFTASAEVTVVAYGM